MRLITTGTKELLMNRLQCTFDTLLGIQAIVDDMQLRRSATCYEFELSSSSSSEAPSSSSSSSSGDSSSSSSSGSSSSSSEAPIPEYQLGLFSTCALISSDTRPLDVVPWVESGYGPYIFYRDGSGGHYITRIKHNLLTNKWELRWNGIHIATRSGSNPIGDYTMISGDHCSISSITTAYTI